jgi:hypothetical protein
MPATIATSFASLSASFRALVLPREHGSWSLALEPVALGLLVAPSRAGAWLALAAVAVFFLRRPLKLTFTTPADDPRRLAAARWAAAFAALALLALSLTLAPGTALSLLSSAQPPEPHGANEQQAVRTLVGLHALWPLLLAAPLGIAFLVFDLRGEARAGEAELCGSLAFAWLPATFATLAGWSDGPALALAVLMMARSAPTVLTVRTALRLAKGRDANAWVALGAAGAFLIGVALLQIDGLVPLAAVFVVGLLTLRSAWLLSRFAPAWSARRIGINEAILGVIFLAVLALAYRVG